MRWLARLKHFWVIFIEQGRHTSNEMRDLGRILRQGFIVYERAVSGSEVRLVFPAELEARLLKALSRICAPG